MAIKAFPTNTSKTNVSLYPNMEDVGARAKNLRKSGGAFRTYQFGKQNFVKRCLPKKTKLGKFGRSLSENLQTFICFESPIGNLQIFKI